MSKRIDFGRIFTQRSDEELDRLLEALVYLVSQRQMRAHWPSRRAVRQRGATAAVSIVAR